MRNTEDKLIKDEKKNFLFFPLNSPLITKSDLMWCWVMEPIIKGSEDNRKSGFRPLTPRIPVFQLLLYSLALSLHPSYPFLSWLFSSVTPISPSVILFPSIFQPFHWANSAVPIFIWLSPPLHLLTALMFYPFPPFLLFQLASFSFITTALFFINSSILSLKMLQARDSNHICPRVRLNIKMFFHSSQTYLTEQ